MPPIRIAGIRAAVAFCLALPLLGAGAQGPAADGRFDFETAPGRLSKDVRPSRYVLRLDLDPARDDFAGSAVIHVDVRREQPSIVLHAKALSAQRATLETGAGRRELRAESDDASQTWRLVPVDGAAIGPGAHRLRIDYSGRVNRTGSGLFVVPHQSPRGPARMLATQLEAVYARSVFPAFDEPAFRAVFELQVRVPRADTVLSNTRLLPAAQRDDGDAVVHRFEPTPPMPTYLFAVAVGRFDVLESRIGKLPLRIYTAPGKREQARYAMRVTQQVLPYFANYFGRPYALPKLDQLAVPGVRGGAMEDWGLISYNEAVLLFDPVRNDGGHQRGVFDIVAHEVAHQWFGNLVTAASWQEIWLNEAFATWMASKASAHFNPAWQVPLRHRIPIDRTMVRDAGPATRAIRSGPVPEDSVFDVFDNITYTKGGAVLSMLEQWIGEAAFRRGLAGYMRARSYSNATAFDLWHHIGQAAGRDLTAVAESWTDQPGFPLVQLATRCEGGRTVVKLRQQRFSNGGDDTGNTGSGQWQIPVQLTRGRQQQVLLLAGAEQQAELAGCGGEPLVANGSGQGFYRVEYEAGARAALLAAFPRLAPSAQVTLLSDTFALAQAGRLPMADYLALLAVLPQARGAARDTLFALAGNGLDFLDTALAGTAQQPLLRAAGRALFVPELAALGWQPRTGEDGLQAELRNTLIRRLAAFEDAPTLAEARRLFERERGGSARIPGAMRAAVLQAAGRSADAALFDALLAALHEAPGEDERWMLASALAATRDPALADKLLATALEGRLPPDVASELPGMLGQNPQFSTRAYAFTVQHWQALADLAGTMFGAAAWLLPNAAWGGNDAALAVQLRVDQARLAGPAGAMAAARAAARIELQAQVKAREAAALGVMLRDWKPQTQTRRAAAAGTNR